MNRNALAIAALLALATVLPAQAGSFAAHHPDQYLRWLGVQHWKAGDAGQAASYFKRAARYGEKTSQLLLATLHLEGQGVPADAALAYAWADLAAERGYPGFLSRREKIWEALDAAQRERALALGRALYAEYGDAVAKPRLDRLLRQGWAQKTGSRAGAQTSSLGVMQFDPSARASMMAAGGFGSHTFTDNYSALTAGGGSALSARWFTGPEDYYAEHHWRPQQYWAWQDAVWTLKGEVVVGELEREAAERGARD